MNRTIVRRLGIGFSWIAAVCLILVTWLWYHEFVEEPEEFAQRGLLDVHKDTAAEASTVCFLVAVPILLGVSWCWMRHVLAPMRALSAAAERIDFHNLHERLPRTNNGDEVDKLAAVFNSMTVRLEQSLRRIHEFTLDASHELKTPLTVMRAQLETVLRENESAPAGEIDWIASQLDEVTRLTRIVDSLTLLTKADAGLVELERQPVHLSQLVEEAFEDAEALGHPGGLQVSLGECDDAVVIGDRHRLRQLLLILADNAVKYNRPGGTIDISLRRVGLDAELRITNTGSAPSPKIMENIFERFARGENARGKVEGCGLGLTIAQWIVQSHGGRIQLLAEPGDKTTAVVHLPAAANRSISAMEMHTSI